MVSVLVYCWQKYERECHCDGEITAQQKLFQTFKDFLFFVSDRLTKTPNKNLCALLQHNLPLKYFRSTWPKIFGSNFSFGDFSAKFFLFVEIHHLTIRLVDWKFWLVQNILIILTYFYTIFFWALQYWRWHCRSRVKGA